MRIKKKIRQELKNIIPDISSQICNSIDWNEIREQNMKTNEETAPHRKWNFKLVSALCCSFLVCCSVALIAVFSQNPGVSPTNQNYLAYEVMLSVEKPQAEIIQNENKEKSYRNITTINFETFNSTKQACPQIKLKVSNKDKVLAQQGMNEDGCILLYKENLVNKDLTNATQTVVKKLNKLGFLDGVVTMCVRDDKGQENQQKQQEVISAIQAIQNIDVSKFKRMDEDAINQLEESFESFKNQITQIEKQIEQKFMAKIDEIILKEKTQITSFSNKIDNYLKLTDNEKLVQYKALKNEIKRFINEYSFEINEDLNAFEEDFPEFNEDGSPVNPEGDTFAEELDSITEKLIDIRSDLEEDLEDLVEVEMDKKEFEQWNGRENSSGNIGDIIEELFEIFKEILFKD